MAKQSGIHQIRGKVGDHSYYKQTGVSGGLIRSINEGMSARVKTGDEYVNTRLNNAEFGQACRIAACLGRFVVPKYRPMILPFSQSKMAKDVLALIKEQTGNWGQRNLTSADKESLKSILDSVSKNDFSEFGLGMGPAGDEVQANDLFAAKLASIGADGAKIQVVYCTLSIGKYKPSDNLYIVSIAQRNSEVIELSTAGSEGITPDYETGLPALMAEVVKFGVLVVMPYRTINSVKHILQEHCAFATVDTALE